MASLPGDLIVSADVGELLGETLVAPEVGQVETLIHYASGKLRSELRRAWGITVADADPDVVKGAMVTAVARGLDALRTGLRVKSEEFPEVRTVYSDYASLVYFTEVELKDFAPEGASGMTATRPHGCFGPPDQY